MESALDERGNVHCISAQATICALRVLHQRLLFRANVLQTLYGPYIRYIQSLEQGTPKPHAR